MFREYLVEVERRDVFGIGRVWSSIIGQGTGKKSIVDGGGAKTADERLRDLLASHRTRGRSSVNKIQLWEGQSLTWLLSVFGTRLTSRASHSMIQSPRRVHLLLERAGVHVSACGTENSAEGMMGDNLRDDVAFAERRYRCSSESFVDHCT